jgi:fructose-specific PTS system IIA-like component
MPPKDTDMTALSKPFEYKFICPLPQGVHARPANCLERVVSGFQSRVSIVNLSNQKVANARSVLSLVGADIKAGDECLLKVDGQDCRLAYNEIVRFLQEEFPGCDKQLPEVSHCPGQSCLPAVLRAAKIKGLFGTMAVPGLGRGKIVTVEALTLPDGIADSALADPGSELRIIDGAVAELSESMRSSLESGNLSETENDVLNAHLAILNDVELLGQIRTMIASRRVCAGKAIVLAFDYFSAMLKSTQSDLIHERVLDLQDVCAQMLKKIYGSCISDHICLTEASVVVADNLTPSQFISMDKHFLSAMVLMHGGSTSHTIILARSFGIPVLTGLKDADILLENGQDVIVAADYGLLIPDINEAVERFYAFERRKLNLKRQWISAFRTRPAVTRDGQRLEVMANVATAEEVETAIRGGAEGIGLFRTEMLYMGRDSAPDEQEQFETYKKAAQAADGKPVIIRTFDIGGDKAVGYLALAREENPFLGYRGVRLYRDYEDLLKIQLRAILRASAYGALKIMIPMVSAVEQVLHVRGVLETAKAELKAQAVEFDASIPVGIMVEIPSVAFIISQMAGVVDFLSIGTNDLTQYFLAVDRANDTVSSLYQSRHPGLLALMKKIVEDAHRSQLWVGMCGEMAGQIANLPLLLGMGLDEVSVSIPYVLDIKAGCTEYDASLCREMVEHAVLSKTIEQVDSVLAGRACLGTAKTVIDVNLIDLEADCLNKEEAIKYASDTLYLDRRTEDPVSLEHDFWRREEVYSTGLGHGYAIPHCKSKYITTDSISVFRLKRSIEWGAVDNQPVDIVIAMAIRDMDKSGEAHMKIFSKLARNIMHESFRETLRKAQSRTEIVKFLSERLELNNGLPVCNRKQR